MNTRYSDSYSFDLDPLEYHPVSTETIQLSDEQIEQAQAQAQRVKNPSQLWQTYRNSLLQLGFLQWLQTRLKHYPLGPLTDTVSIQASQHPSSEIGVLLTVNGFRICLLTEGYQPEDRVAIPQQVVDPIRERAHFFVIGAIAEEQGCVTIYAVLRQDQLIQQRSQLTLEADQTYTVPLSWFNPDVNSLLLYLRCSEPATFDQSEAQTIDAPRAQRVSHLGNIAVNTALWLEGQLDAIAQTLAWRLLPPPPFPTAMRSGSGAVPDSGLPEAMQSMPEDSNYYRLIQELRAHNVNIPDYVRPAYRDIKIADQLVRLYALSWQVEAAPSSADSSPSDSDAPEWTLVVILGPTADQDLPRGIRLVVADQDQVLIQKQLNAVVDQYLFTEVVGGLHEIFQANLQLGEQQMQTPLVFSFQPGQQ